MIKLVGYIALGFFILGLHSSYPNGSSECHYVGEKIVRKYNLPFIAGCRLGDYINIEFK
jgi:hypothetical protein